MAMVALAVGIVIAGAFFDRSRAISVVTPQAGPAGPLVTGHRDGALVKTVTALSSVEINGETKLLFEADLSHPVEFGVGYTEGQWSSVNVSNIGQVTRLLSMTDATQSHDPVEIAAAQAALWHLSDRFELDRSAGANDEAVVSRYDQLTQDAVAHPEPAEARATIRIGSDDTRAMLGDTVKIEVSGDAATPWSIELSNSSAIAHPMGTFALCDTARVITAMAAPGTICVSSSGSATFATDLMLRSASRWTNEGRVFRRDGRRSLIMANRVAHQTTATASIHWETTK